MVGNKKYVELLWAEKYDKPRIKGGITAPLFPEDEWPEDYPMDWKDLLIWGDNKLVMSSLIKQGWIGSDLSKFAIQVTRKRLLDIHNLKDLQEEEK